MNNNNNNSEIQGSDMTKVQEYLRKPYGRVVLPEADGTYRAEIVEFPGCIATGNTAAEALASVEDVAASWLEVVIAKGRHVPEPIDHSGYSGKLVLRLPKSLHKKAAYMAAHDGVSLNQFIVSSLAEQVGAKSISAEHPPRWTAFFAQIGEKRSVDTAKGAGRYLYGSVCGFTAMKFTEVQHACS